MKRLYLFYHNYSGGKAFILFLQLIQYGVSVAAPFVFGSLIAMLSKGGYSLGSMVGPVLTLLTLNAAEILAGRWYTCRVAKETAHMELELKVKALEIYHNLEEETRSSRSAGEWEHRIAADSSIIATCSCPLFSAYHGALLVVFLTLSIVIADKPVFLLPVLLCGAAFAALFQLRQKRLLELNKKLRECSYTEYTTLLDILSLKSVMRVFRVVPFLSQRYRDTAVDCCRSSVESQYFSAAYASEIRLLMWLVDSCVLILSLFLFFRHTIGLDSLIAYGLLIGRITGQMGQLLFSIPQFSRGIECAAAMEEYWKLAAQGTSGPELAPTSVPDELLQLKEVSFSYKQPHKTILKNINCSVRKGRYITIMGKNGEGKSTLIKLLVGELTPNSGKLLSRVQRPSYVPQNVGIFHGTLRDNLTLCNKSISTQAIEDAIRTTRLQSIVERIGLNSNISQEQLSGGELQRIGIARALLINPDLLIVDELTNHLDILNKELIFNILKKQKERCTIISISHDLEAFEDSDECLLLSDGQLHPIEGTTGVEKRANLYHMLNHE